MTVPTKASRAVSAPARSVFARRGVFLTKACFFQAARRQLPVGTAGTFTRGLSEPGDTRTSKISVVRILGDSKA